MMIRKCDVNPFITFFFFFFFYFHQTLKYKFQAVMLRRDRNDFQPRMTDLAMVYRKACHFVGFHLKEYILGLKTLI